MNSGAQQLKDWRKGTALSQMDAAVLLKVHLTTYSCWENGRRLPTRAQALTLRTEMEIPIDAWDELLEVTDAK